MPAAEAQLADCAWSYGMKLSWDINDPQMPQVRETRCARGFLSKEEGCLGRDCGQAALPPLTPKGKKSNTSLRALQCSGTPPMAELGLEMCLLPPVSSDSFENDRKQRELSIRLHVSGRLAGGSLTPRPSLSFNRGRNPLTLPCPFFDIH